MLKFLTQILEALKSLIARAIFRAPKLFYIALAVVFVLVFAVLRLNPSDLTEPDYSTLDITEKWLSRLLHDDAQGEHRVLVIEIDEASLASMAPDHGRWPWSRAVIAEFLEYLAAYEPGTVGVDILFSDPDLRDPEGDAYLDEVVGGMDKLYLTALRLPARNDILSSVDVSLLPALTRPETSNQKTVAVLLPFLDQAMRYQRFAFGNFAQLLEDDGMVRRYPVTINVHGHALPSMAASLARDTVDLAALPGNIILNFVSGKNNVERISFMDAFDGLRSGDERVTRHVRDAAVVIGLTAPGLTDVKPIATDEQVPGLYVLAFATENLLNDHWFRDLGERLGIGLFLALTLLALTVAITDISNAWVDITITLVELSPIAIGILLLLFMQSFADLEFASKFGLSFYLIARVCQGIYRSELREGFMLIDNPRFEKLDIVLGSYCFHDSKEHAGSVGRMLTKIKRAHRQIAVSDEVYGDSTGLFAKAATNGGVIYGVVEAGAGPAVMAALESALSPFSSKMDHAVTCHESVDNSWEIIRMLLADDLPEMTRRINR